MYYILSLLLILVEQLSIYINEYIYIYIHNVCVYIYRISNSLININISLICRNEDKKRTSETPMWSNEHGLPYPKGRSKHSKVPGGFP